MGEPERVKLVYRLVRDDRGWPPVEAERLWAVPLGHDTYRIDNIPFFVPNLAMGDVVRAVAVGGYLLPLSRVGWSGNRTVRVRPQPDGPIAGRLDEIFDRFGRLGVEGEGSAAHGVAALSVPASVAPGPVRDLLREGWELGWWDYEEACVDADWFRDGVEP